MSNINKVYLCCILVIYALMQGCKVDNSQNGSSSLSSESIDAYLQSREIGIEAYDKGKYEYALKCFTSVEKIAPPNNDLRNWIKKCQLKIIPLDFVLVQGGTLKAVKEWNWKSDQELSYDLKLDSFYICKYELTQIEYKRVMGELKQENYKFALEQEIYQHPNGKEWIDETKYVECKGDSLPVSGSYMEFVLYCNKRSHMEGFDGFYIIEKNTVTINKEGNGYRLLSPFEWTYAAKGGLKNEQYRYIGSNNIHDVAWFGGNSKGKPHLVGRKNANSLCLYDMAGNVTEMLEGVSKRWGDRLEGGGSFTQWLGYSENLLGPTHFILGMQKNRRTGTRIAFIPRGMKNNNLDLQPKYDW